MKVAHLTLSDAGGGAAKAVFRLHKALQSQGIDGTLHVARKWSDDPSVISLSADLKLGGMAIDVSRRLDLLPLKLAHPKVKGFWSPGWHSLRSIASIKAIADADLICLYWLPRGFLGIRQVQKILHAGKPVIWRLSDMWPFTGGCHYSGGCDRYLDSCGKCPQLNSNSPRDISYHLLTSKYRRWRGGSLTVVSPSAWMAACARNSAVLGSRPIQVIATGVDIDVFRPISKPLARAALGLPLDKTLVLYGADAALTDPRKGHDVVISALNGISTRQIADLPGLVLFGTSNRPVALSKSIAAYPLGVIQDEITLPIIYSACDLFVAPSREDNLPNSVLEAMACGLPVIATNVGGLPEAVIHNGSGLLVSHGDPAAMIDALENLLFDRGRREQFGRRARVLAETDFNLAKQAQRYVTLFKELLPNAS